MIEAGLMEGTTPILTRVVLDLLATDSSLTTAAAWRDALSSNASLCVLRDGAEAVAGASTSSIVDVVGDILPCLPVYEPFHARLCGLLSYCEEECKEGVVYIFKQWLCSTPATVQFRQWLYGYVDRHTDSLCLLDGRRWRRILMLAAMKEEDRVLRWTLLQYIDAKCTLIEDIEANPKSATCGVLQLLSFCWHESDQLGAAPALCAAKIAHALTTTLVNWDEVLVVLQWGQLLKPFLFTNVVRYLVTAKAIPPKHEPKLPALRSMCDFVDISIKEAQGLHIAMTQYHQQLQDTYTRRVASVRRSSLSSRYLAHLSRPGNASPELILRMAHDLTLVPGAVFPDVFAIYLVAVIQLLEGKPSDVEAVGQVITSLFSILELRDDESSCLIALSGVVDLDATSHSVWKCKPSLFVQTIERLSEAMVLARSELKKWALSVALHCLLLGCDAQVLNEAAAMDPPLVPVVVPASIRPLVRERLSTVSDRPDAN